MISHVRKTFAALLALVALAALAGCGGSSDESGGSGVSGGGDAKTTLPLVAYSTPQVVYDEIIPDFQKTAEGKGVGFKTLLRRLRRPEPRGRGAARRPTSWRSRPSPT